MKVLFAVNDENVSDEIVKKYQKDYKEIISYKNVYYFNAIIKEMQRDKSYDRIVIGEDLEPFANNNYDTIDKFLFEKLDSISDEATDNGEKDAQIILICSDRRTKSDKLLVKLFGIGIYSAIIGRDRSVEEVCRLINNPRTKKEAKQYYHIDSEDVDYKAENDTDVNEKEIQSILKHYKSLGKNEDKYVESFENIASQYTDAQLRVIIRFLPISVKAVLEEKSAKYQQLVMFGDTQYKKNNTSNIIKSSEKNKLKGNSQTNFGKADKLNINSIEERINNPLTGKPIVIPTVIKKERTEEIERKLEEFSIPETSIQETEEIQAPIIENVKRGRGRPKKIVDDNMIENNPNDSQIKRGRGRPKKILQENDNLYELSPDENSQNDNIESDVLPGLEDIDVNVPTETNVPYTPASILPGLEENEPAGITYNEDLQSANQDYENVQQNYYQDEKQIENIKGYNEINNTNSLFTSDKKIVAFVGSPKNGTSFIVNNLAQLLSSMGINTAILDLTDNKNSYYIYTKNEEELRKITYSSVKKLKEGIAEGIHVNKYLSVYTSLPGEEEDKTDSRAILKTLADNHSIVLLDCDFNTPHEYFDLSQEIYLVQSMDILTIQPLTAFLRDLKNDGILKQEKIKVVINKNTKIRGLSEKLLLGGMAFYNAPSMSFMTELFNKDSINPCLIPLDTNTYTAYLEAMVSCDISLNRYSKVFMQSLKQLAGMVYPLLNKQTYREPNDYKKNRFESESKGYFSDDINSTLEQMNRMKNNGY